LRSNWRSEADRERYAAFVCSTEDSGVLIASSDFPSAATPSHASVQAAMTSNAALPA
jgi:hypothetical protein